jgi:hypothetical protein
MIGPQNIWSVFCYIEEPYLRIPVMKESNPIGQMVQFNMTMFATRLRLLLELCNIESYAIKMNIMYSVYLLFSFKNALKCKYMFGRISCKLPS